MNLVEPPSYSSSEAIPALFIGQKQGRLLGRPRRQGADRRNFPAGELGNVVCKTAQPAGRCATIYRSERFELDLETNGNPLDAAFASVMRMTTCPLLRMAALVGKRRKGSSAA